MSSSPFSMSVSLFLSCPKSLSVKPSLTIFSKISTPSPSYPFLFFFSLQSTYCYLTYYIFYLFCLSLDSPLECKLPEGKVTVCFAHSSIVCTRRSPRSRQVLVTDITVFHTETLLISVRSNEENMLLEQDERNSISSSKT